VGLRAITCAAFTGFRDVHIFGMDGNEGEDGAKHAAAHPNEPQKHQLVEYPEKSGKMWRTTPSMLEAARTTFHELDQLSKVKATFYGEGLVQEMAKAWTPGAKVMPFDNVPAIQKPPVITEEFRALNAQLHRDNALYGAGGHKHAETVLKLIESIKAKSILDYGCGKGTLASMMPFPIWEYDPAIPGKEELPRAADLVVCFDVLEHIEPDLLGNVLANLKSVTKSVGYFVIHMGPAQKVYADGRNTHLIQRPRGWWEQVLAKFFQIGQIFEKGNELHVVVAKKEVAQTAGDVTKVVYDNIGVSFVTPNEATKWRAQTLFTKEKCTIAWIDTFKPGEVFYDVGANVGGYSVWAVVRRGVKVVAFEPEASNYALLCRNLVLNKVDGFAYCVALTDEPKFSVIYLSSQGPGGSCHTFDQELGPELTPREGIPQGAIGMRLDDLEGHFPPPDHIKIDVDGLEHKVLAGAKELLASGKVKSILVEINPKIKEHTEILETLKAAGYYFDPQQVKRATRKEGQFTGVAEHVFYLRRAPDVKVLTEEAA
jgi:FkbM family methyltransferase